MNNLEPLRQWPYELLYTNTSFVFGFNSIPSLFQLFQLVPQLKFCGLFSSPLVLGTKLLATSRWGDHESLRKANPQFILNIADVADCSSHE
jgi:hypothetical protein